MNWRVRSIVKMLRTPVDLVLSVIIIPAAYLLYSYRRTGAVFFPKTTSRLRSIGVFPIVNHYYEPLFDNRLLAASLDADRNLPGVKLELDRQLVFLETLSYSDELKALDLNRRTDDLHAFHLGNGSYEAGDADFLYQFIRGTKPAKIVEIGSGYSTKIARLAARANARSGAECRQICVEPYEQRWLEDMADISVIRKLIEDVPFDWSQELKSGDLLFIDSSHMIRPQGDVLKIYLDILPRLAAGVYIHIHDIFTPKDYLKSWVEIDVRFWNEQYLLEGILDHSGRYEVIASLNHLKHHHYEKLQAVCPYLTANHEPGSFYLRVRDGQ